MEKTANETVSKNFRKEELLEIVTKLLLPAHDLRFLSALDEMYLEQLIVAIRVRLEKG